MEQPAQLDFADILATSLTSDSITLISQQFCNLFDAYWSQFSEDSSVSMDIAPTGNFSIHWVLPNMYIQLDLYAEEPHTSSINYVVYVDPASKDQARETTPHQVYVHSPQGSWKYSVELLTLEPDYVSALTTDIEGEYSPDTYFPLFVGILYESLTERYQIASQYPA